MHFDGAAAAAARPECTGIGIGAPVVDEVIRDVLVLLNSGGGGGGGGGGGDDDSGGGGGGGGGGGAEDGSLAAPHQCHLYGDVHLHRSGFVLRVPGQAPMAVSFYDDDDVGGVGGDVAYAAVVDICPQELSLLHITFTEKARDILFSEVRAAWPRALAWPRRSAALHSLVPCLVYLQVL